MCSKCLILKMFGLKLAIPVLLIVSFVAGGVYERELEKVDEILGLAKNLEERQEPNTDLLECNHCLFTQHEPCVYETVTCSKDELCGELVLDMNVTYNGCVHSKLCSLNQAKCCNRSLCNW